MAHKNFHPKSIEDYGGIYAYLTARKEHNNGYDGHDLKKFVAARVSVSSIARLMSNDPSKPRSINTIKDWIEQL